MKGMMAALALVWGISAVYAQEAVIMEISGTVELRAGGAEEWRPAQQGQGIGRDTVISTGFKSAALIGIGESTLVVRPLTRLSLEELAEGNKKINIGLRTGRVRADIKAPQGGKIDFTVRSPMVTASVRGTVFEFDGIRLQVEEGRVHLAGDSGGVYIGTGHEGRIEIETGRPVGAAETALEVLLPPLPVGMDSAPEVKTAAPAPAAGDVEAGFAWL